MLNILIADDENKVCQLIKSLVDWEAEWAESGTALAVGMVAAAAVAIIALLVIKKNAGKKAAVN